MREDILDKTAGCKKINLGCEVLQFIGNLKAGLSMVVTLLSGVLNNDTPDCDRGRGFLEARALVCGSADSDWRSSPPGSGLAPQQDPPGVRFHLCASRFPAHTQTLAGRGSLPQHSMTLSTLVGRQVEEGCCCCLSRLFRLRHIGRGRHHGWSPVSKLDGHRGLPV